MNIDADRLMAACEDASGEGGIVIRSMLDPLGGQQAPVKPAVYAGGVFQEDLRWWGDPQTVTRVIVIDNVPSQANRLEASLEALRPSLGLPELVLDLSGIPSLPQHLPRRISSFRFPHRQADAYLRDAMADHQKFSTTDVGRALINATVDRPQALFQWFPQALLFGYWQSHLGNKRSQAKLARSWVSEIAGYDPATGEDAHRTRVQGLKGDPLNLSIDEPVTFDKDDVLQGWDVVAEGQKTGRAKSNEALSEIGHGQVPFRASDGALAPVSFRAIEQRTTVSFAGLRRISLSNPSASAAGRALLVALGLVAHVGAFGRAFSLRSGCDLRSASTQWTWLSPAAEEPLDALAMDEALALFKKARALAEMHGVTSDGGWDREPLVLTPAESLVKAITGTWPLAPA
jgi:CRISPR-associated protein Csb1